MVFFVWGLGNMVAGCDLVGLRSLRLFTAVGTCRCVMLGTLVACF